MAEPRQGGNRHSRPDPQTGGGPPTPTESVADRQRRLLREKISAYPASLTYIDLIRRNKIESALLIVGMLLLGAIVGAVIGAAVSLPFQSAGGDPMLRGTGMDRPRELSLLAPALVGGCIALVIASVSAAWSWFGGGNAILRMNGARELKNEEDPELFNVVDEMRIAAGLPMPRVYVINSDALNAFATGRDPAHAAVAITRGLRRRLTRDELQGVMAHEIAHIRHYDIRFAMLMALMVGLIVVACDVFLRMTIYGGLRGRGMRTGGGRGGGGGAAIAMLIMFLVALLLAIIAPVLARVIQMTYSRRREYLADAGAVELTRYPDGIASALAKLADDPKPELQGASRGTAHMYIVNPMKKMRQSHQRLDSVFCSHPPVQKRIARLLALTR